MKEFIHRFAICRFSGAVPCPSPFSRAGSALDFKSSQITTELKLQYGFAKYYNKKIIMIIIFTIIKVVLLLC